MVSGLANFGQSNFGQSILCVACVVVGVGWGVGGSVVLCCVFSICLLCCCVLLCVVVCFAVRVVLRSTLANPDLTNFGQSNFGQSNKWPIHLDLGVCCGPKGWGPKTEKLGQRRVGQRKVGGPIFRAFFHLPPPVSFFSSLPLGYCRGFLVVFGSAGDLKCACSEFSGCRVKPRRPRCGGRWKKESEILGVQRRVQGSGFWGQKQKQNIKKMKSKRRRRRRRKRKRKKSKRKRRKQEKTEKETEQTPLVRLRPISTSASWPKSSILGGGVSGGGGVRPHHQHEPQTQQQTTTTTTHRHRFGTIGGTVAVGARWFG